MIIESDSDGFSDTEIISSNNVMADLTLPAVPKPTFNSTLFPSQSTSSTSTPQSHMNKKSRLEQLKEQDDVEMLSQSVENMSMDLIESDDETDDELMIHESFKKRTTADIINLSSSNQVYELSFILHNLWAIRVEYFFRKYFRQCL